MEKRELSEPEVAMCPCGARFGVNHECSVLPDFESRKMLPHSVDRPPEDMRLLDELGFEWI